MKILIVEDSHVNRTILKKYLKPFGECEQAENGKIGVEMFENALKGEETEPYDLICMDIAMPEMDGHEAVRNIRQIEKEAGITDEHKVKILMISAYSDKTNVIKAAKEDAQGFIVKPIQADKLYEKLMKLGFSPKEELPKTYSLFQFYY